MSSDVGAPPPKAPISRSRRGCLTCRSRKVKCDETPVKCNNCHRMALDCIWKADENQMPRRKSSAASASTSQQRDFSHRRVACQRCRSIKHRCSRERPTCHGCRAAGEVCVYDDRRQSAGNASPLPSTTHDRRASYPQRETHPREISQHWRSELEKGIEAYFKFVYPNSVNAIIHRAELRKSVQEYGLDQPLIKAIAACSYRFLDVADPLHPDGGVTPSIWSSEVRQYLGDTMGQISETRLTTLLILWQHESNSGRHSTCWMLSAMAVRAAFALRCNVEGHKEGIPWIAEEARRRLMWCAFKADMFASAGIDEYTLIPPGTMRCLLPTDNHSFARGMATKGVKVEDAEQGIPLQQGQDGLLSRQVRLSWIRATMLKYVKNLSRYPVPAWQPDSIFHQVIAKLQIWRETLPADLELDAANLFLWQGSDELNQLLALHMWYDQIYCDLCRLALPGFVESAPAQYLAMAPPAWIAQTQLTCYEHALSQTRHFALVEAEFPDLVLSDMCFATFAYESMRNQLQYTTSIGSVSSVRSYLDMRGTAEGFDLMVRVIRKTTRYFFCMRGIIRDLNTMLNRHGYPVDSSVEAPSTPEEDHPSPDIPVISRQHWLRRLWNEREGTDRPPTSTTPTSQDRLTTKPPGQTDISPGSTLNQSLPATVGPSPVVMADPLSSDLSALWSGLDQQLAGGLQDVFDPFFGLLDTWTAGPAQTSMDQSQPTG